MSYILDEEKSWVARDFGLDRRLIKALSKLNFTYPTLVQSKCIPIAIQGKDVLVRARTGSGKTFAFGLPLLHKLLVMKSTHNEETIQTNIFGVILVPTKELCKQVERSINDLIYYCKDFVSILSLVTEESKISNHGSNIRLRHNIPDIIISTPAKLVQHIKTNSIDVSKVKMLVIDEADLILSFGYAEDVQMITSYLPKIVQGLLMSATLSPALDKFKRIVLDNPAILKLEEPVSSGKLLQFYLATTPQDKYLILYVFLKLGLLQGKGLIFVNDVNKCYRLKLVLQQFFINAAVLNAEMPLNSRLHVIDEFNRGVFDYLIATDSSIDAGNDDDDDDDDNNDDDDGNNDDSHNNNHNITDTTQRPSSSKKRPFSESKSESKPSSISKNQKVSADKDQKSGYGVHRGLDFQGVSFVINFDFPPTSAAYTHRIGRTARAGASGTALSFASLPKLPGDSNREEDNSVRDFEVLRQVQNEQPRLGIVEGDNILAAIGATGIDHSQSNDETSLQPSPLAFDMKEIESFRYRVEDTVRSVTATAVKELRTAELKREILNSEKLKSFFSENPNDFKILRHDKSVAHPIKAKEHLKIVPSYLIPQSMQAIASNHSSNKNSNKNHKKKRRKINGVSSSSGNGNSTQDQRVNKSKMRDPLRNPLSTSATMDDSLISSEDVQIPVEDTSDRIYSNKEASNLGYGISGRKKWKMKHHKGPYNSRLHKKNSNRIKGSFQGKKGG